MRLILGSASQRRRALLEQIGIIPDEVRVADIDESPRAGELGRHYVKRMSDEKACALMPLKRGDVLLVADTIAVVGRRILGKPRDIEEAKTFLERLSGRRHHVITSFHVCTQERRWQRTVKTIVRFRQLTPRLVEEYLESDEWQGKAGAYAIQGRAEAFVAWISGSYSNVVGLPLCESASLLRHVGIVPTANAQGAV